jgi:hypothetical protein
MKQEAYRLIDKMPDETVHLLVEFIYQLSPKEKKSRATSGSLIKRYTENVEKLKRISELKDNWNENGAKAFPKSQIEKVSNILTYLDNQPEIFPTACDSIQLEFDNGKNHLEIEIFNNDNAETYCVDEDGKETFGTVPAEGTKINDFVWRFYGQ